MGAFVLRRLALGVFTIFGVMVLTFFLFRTVAGDIAAAHVGEKATEEVKADWRHKYGYDLPMWVNLHERLKLVDQTEGDDFFRVRDPDPARNDLTDRLALLPADDKDIAHEVRFGRYVFDLDRDTPIAKLTEAPGPPAPGSKERGEAKQAQAPAGPKMKFTVATGATFTVDVAGVETCGGLIDRINNAPQNRKEKTDQPRVHAEISDWSAAQLFHSQFFDHLVKSATFQGVSLRNKKKLTEIIADRAPRSLALMIPITGIGWMLSLVVASFVAYFRGTFIDRAGTFLSVLGMCVPVLAFLIYGQLLAFEYLPDYAHGLEHRAAIYIPISILVLAGLGASVRFYRTIILDETNREYVRTARAKGAPLGSVLFRHVLRNCMLPILTRLILTLPFLILGSLLAETIFGIPGLGDLLITSINGRDEPVMTGLVYLTALIYTVALIVTDISYALFDPRVRLR